MTYNETCSLLGPIKCILHQFCNRLVTIIKRLIVADGASGSELDIYYLIF